MIGTRLGLQLEADGKFTFYSWLSPQQFEFLSKTNGEQTLSAWVRGCNTWKKQTNFTTHQPQVSAQTGNHWK
eukprot:5118907-Amphidinium_carterae.1